jgi:hypothetical protein
MRTKPPLDGAWMKCRSSSAIATCSSLLRRCMNMRSPACSSARATGRPDCNCSTAVRGIRRPAPAAANATRPLQSKPPGESPPKRYGWPSMDVALLISNARVPGAVGGAGNEWAVSRVSADLGTLEVVAHAARISDAVPARSVLARLEPGSWPAPRRRCRRPRAICRHISAPRSEVYPRIFRVPR